MRKILFTIFLLPVLSLANTITLNQCIQRIQDNSPLINIAIQNIKLNEQAKRKQDSIYHSSLKPKIDFNSEYEQNTQTNLLTNTINFSYNLSSYYINQTNLSKEFLNSSLKIQKEIVISSLIYNIKINYYKLTSLKYRLQILYKEKVILNKLKMITKKLVDKGVKLPSDILKIEDRINILNNHILIKKENISFQKNKLINMIYNNSSTNINFENIDISFKEDKDTEKLMLNIKYSPQIKNLTYRLQSLKYENININKNLYPKLYSSIEHVQDFHNNSNSESRILVGINIPLFVNDTRSYDTQIKQIKILKQQLQIKKRITDIKNELKQHIYKIRLDTKLYKNYQNTISHQKKTLKSLKLEYQAGLNINISTLIGLQKDIVDMGMKKISTYFDYLNQKAKINNLLGEK